MATSPAPDAAAPPGMCPGIAVLGGGGAGGDGDGDGSGGKDGSGGNGSGKGNGAGDDGKGAQGAPDYTKFPECGYESHPVDVVTGRAFTHPITDLELPGPLPLIFSRMYSSKMADRDVGLGYGWGHTFGWEIEVTRREIRVWNEQGVAVDFPAILVGDQIVGPWGWLLRREPWGFAVDADDGVWRMFSAPDERGKRCRLTAIEDFNGNRISLVHDGDKLIKVVDSVGRIIRVSSTRSGRIASIEIQNAASQGRWIPFATYAYDDDGNLISAIDADGFSATYEYDDEHLLVSDTDRTGLTFHFVYDAQHRCVESWGDYPGRRDPSLADRLPTVLADGVTRIKGVHHCRFDYLSDGYTEVANSTEIRRYFGNKHGTLDKAVLGDGVMTCTYDDHGFLTARVDELDATITYERDARGRIMKITDPLSRVTQIRRDPHGLPIEVIDPGGGVSRVHRDGAGNVQFLVNAAGATTSYVNDGRGLPTEVTLPNGGQLRVTYDAHANPAHLVQPDGSVWRWTSDYLGRVLEEIDPLGAATRYVYSDRGDVISMTEPDGGTTRYSYDGEEHLTEVIDSAGHREAAVFGGYHRLCRRQDENGNVVQYRYDYEGHLVELVNEKGEVHQLTYSAGGNLIEEKTFDGRTFRYRHDAAGRVVELIDGLRGSTLLVYDLAGQLVERTFADDTGETFEYDACGGITVAKGRSGTVSVTRDELGQIVSETVSSSGGAGTVETAYDVMGRRISRRTSLGHVEQIDRDVMGNPARTVLGEAFEILHTSDVLGREIVRSLPGGGRIESAYDVMGQLYHRAAVTPVVHRPTTGEPGWMGRRASDVATERRYKYEGGQLREITGRRGGPVRFEYDPVGQLTAALPERGREEVFHYDPAGNLFESGGEERVYGRGNRLLQKGPTHYVWDDNGRLIEKRRREHGLEEVWRYKWDAKSLLESVATPDGGLIEFAYDPFRRRVRKRVSRALTPGERPTPVEVTSFVWDGDLLVHEIRERARAGGDPIVDERTYCFEDQSFAPMAHEATSVRGGDRQRSGWFQYLNDVVGTPEALILSNGHVAHEVDRTTWGGMDPETPGRPSTPLRFAGQYADEETGLSYSRFRYYDPETATFISADPISIEGGLNEFGYVPDPNTWIDPFGLAKTPRMRVGDNLEKKRKKELNAQGYEVLPSKVGSGNGPDIVAVKRDSLGKVVEMRIEECKANSSKLGKSAAGKQMSDPWLDDNVNKMKKKGGCTGKTGQEIEDFKNGGGTIEKFLIKGKQKAPGKQWNMKPPKKLP